MSERFVSHKIEDCEALLAMRVDVVFRWTCLVACLGLTFVGAREERRWWSRRLVDGVPDEDPWEMDGSYEDSSVPQFMYREGRAWFEDPRDEKLLARTRYPRWPFAGILESFEDAVSPFDDAVTPFDDEVDAIQTQGEFLQPYHFDTDGDQATFKRRTQTRLGVQWGIGVNRELASTMGKVPASPWFRLWDMDVAWTHIHRAEGEYDWGKLDHIVNQQTNAGQKISYVFGATPRWVIKRDVSNMCANKEGPGKTACLSANPNGGPPAFVCSFQGQPARDCRGSNMIPKNKQPFYDFVKQLCTRYKHKIHAYEVWNEPQLAIYLFPYREQLAELAEMHIQAYDIIKECDPGAKVLGASLLPRHSSGGMARANFYIDALVKGAREKKKRKIVDNWNIHIYSPFQPNPNSIRDYATNIANKWKTYYNDAKRNLLNSGAFVVAKSRAIWVTETTVGMCAEGTVYWDNPDDKTSARIPCPSRPSGGGVAPETAIDVATSKSVVGKIYDVVRRISPNSVIIWYQFGGEHLGGLDINTVNGQDTPAWKAIQGLPDEEEDVEEEGVEEDELPTVPSDLNGKECKIITKRGLGRKLLLPPMRKSQCRRACKKEQKKKDRVCFYGDEPLRHVCSITSKYKKTLKKMTTKIGCTKLCERSKSRKRKCSFGGSVFFTNAPKRQKCFIGTKTNALKKMTTKIGCTKLCERSKSRKRKCSFGGSVFFEDKTKGKPKTKKHKWARKKMANKNTQGAKRRPKKLNGGAKQKPKKLNRGGKTKAKKAKRGHKKKAKSGRKRHLFSWY